MGTWQVSVIAILYITPSSIHIASYCLLNYNHTLWHHRSIDCIAEPGNPSEVRTSKLGTHIPCPHGRSKHQCHDCGGSSLCVHNKLRQNCFVCNPTSKAFCKCGKRKDNCLVCNPTSKAFCKCGDGKRKANCLTCSPHLFCVHNRKRSDCNEC